MEKAEMFLFMLSFVSVLILILITAFILKEGLPIFTKIGLFNFLFGWRWAPYYESYGVFPLFYGSIMIVFGSKNNHN